MSIAIKTHIYCNECGATYGVDIDKNGAQLRKLSKQEGWSKSGDRDYCPECRQKRKSNAIKNRPKKYAKKYHHTKPDSHS